MTFITPETASESLPVILLYADGGAGVSAASFFLLFFLAEVFTLPFLSIISALASNDSLALTGKAPNPQLTNAMKASKKERLYSFIFTVLSFYNQKKRQPSQGMVGNSPKHTSAYSFAKLQQKIL
jgi:hypothetical protein